MVELINYSEEYKTETINRMADFFGYHSGLFTGKVELTEESYEEAGKTLQDWLSEDHELYLIKYDSIVVGFLHLWYKGYVKITEERKYRMEIVKIIDSDKTKYMELLLIADEQVSMIEKYLYRGEMFALLDDDVKAICVVTQEQPGVYEIKNIVTVPEYQQKGYGQCLISFIADECKKSGSELYVGTGDCPGILHFYEKCGFVKSHIVKDFFIDNYDHPMYENGQQLVDMIYLKRKL